MNAQCSRWPAGAWRAVVVAVAALVGPLGVASGASGATQIGQTTDSPGNASCNAGASNPTVRWQHTTDPASASYAVPAGGGVITSWTTNPGANAGTSTRLEVVREGPGAAAGTNIVVGESDVQANIPPHNAASFPTRIPVQAGDVIGLEIATGTTIFCASPGNPGDSTIRSSDPGPGNALTQVLQQGGFLVDVSAVVEPDADGDGFGDQTQDQCPTDPTTQAACQADLSITETADKAAARVGDTITYTLAVKNNSSYNTATAVSVSDALPANLQLVSATASVGTCSAATCSLGDLAKGATATITLLARATGEGTAADTATLTSTTPDPNSANNAASTITNLVGFPGVTLLSKSARVKKGKVRLSLACPATAVGNCVGTDALRISARAKKGKRKKAKTLTLGRASFSVAPGKTVKVTIKLSKNALKLFGPKTHKLKARQIVVAHDSLGPPKTSAGTATLKN
jgi:uncharacterized repeat protein (TIGR01451 family)